MGVYRLWRDGGFAVGVLTAASGIIVLVRMHETHARPAGETKTDACQRRQ